MRIDKNTTIRLGNRNIVKVKLGDVVIWQKNSEPVVGPDYFYIESLGDGNTISLKNKGDGSTGGVTPTLEYSTDKNTWNTITFDWTSGNHTTELPVKLNTGEKMYFRNDTRLFSISYNKYITFSSSVSSNVGGDIRTLSNYLDVNSETKSNSYMFINLFYNNQYIVDASNLRLPYTSLQQSCYESMFLGCTSLTTAPALPATSLSFAYSCYKAMFLGCTSLTTAPALPATTLEEGCYYYMFQGCTSLTTAPALPATTLADSCYNSMFNGCTSLTTAPELPATTLASKCYSQMFSNCSKLTVAPELPATTIRNYCYNEMFSGCTSLVNAPELPATTLKYNCYYSMFSGCSELTTAPALPATTLVDYCYRSMFSGCKSINSITVYAEDISASDCTKNWLYGVASSGTFNNMGFATYSTDSTSGIPTGWTEILPEIQSITANPDTFTIKSYKSSVNCKSTLTITTTTGITATQTNTATITVGENTGDTTRTLTETIPYKGSSYQVTIVQTANDVKPTPSWNVESTGTYPFQLNTNGYYESTNKGQSSSYSYATLNYSGFDELVLECINSSESYYDYGIISQPDVQLSKSSSDDGATGSTKVFKNFKGQSSTNPVQIIIPSDEGSHFITIKFIKDSGGNLDNDSLQFKVIEP